MEGFDAAVPSGGYRWWYLDGLSDDGQHGLTIIGFVGSVFSPYYASARRKGGADPENHCALNVALYGRGGHRWSMTERGRNAIARSLDHFTIGPSAMRWEDGVLVIDIDEVTVPIPSRLKGQVRLTPSAICGHEVRLDHGGQHVWQPVAPFSRIEAVFEKPALRWSGVGYHDSNWGEVPLEDSFESWVWSRAARKDGASIIYDTILRDGSSRAFALRIGADGAVDDLPLPQHAEMSTTFWRMKRHMRAAFPFRTVALLEDSPFYSRTLLRVRTDDGAEADAFHESLSLSRFRNPVVQMMLPFRMPRRA
ncbi:carotenoid 1,2-hydratase [Aestuariivirga sp.]|uniref:carotenoid 1,2-hydratase n=1 Tax=Aestuariivirga sp. TaxID=2650926 RepID=UPI003593DD67